jgi:hypothetical protein
MATPGKYEAVADEDRDLAERLYASTADEELGSVQEADGWFGLFRQEKVILSEDSQGFLEIDTFETIEALEIRWQAMVEEDQQIRDENPGDEDLLESASSSDGGQTWYMNGKLYFTGSVEGLREQFRKDGYFPNIYMVSDHGNVHLVRE